MVRRVPKVLLSATAIAAAMTLTLAGCSAKSAQTPDMEEGPLSKYLSALWDGEEYSEEMFQEQQLKAEELIAECMQKEGFEYEPDVQNLGTFMSEEDQEGPQWGSKEYAEQYGYGFSDSPDRESMEETTDTYVDPNGKYLESLSESEREAFYETLHGPQPTEEEWALMEEEGESWSPDISEQGCWGAANAEARQGQDNYTAASEDPEFSELFEAINEVWNTEGNEETAKLDREWATCMADAGYPDFTTAWDAQDFVMNEQNSLYDYENLGEDEMPKEPSKQELDALKKQEIEVATADFACKEKTDYEKKSVEIMFAAEQEFVDKYKPQLDALVAKYQVSADSKSKDK